MNRPVLIAIISMAVIAAFLSIPWVLGLIVESEIRDLVDDLGGDMVEEERLVVIENYHRGYRKSVARTRVRLGARAEDSFLLKHEVTHAVFGRVSANRVESSSKPCLARILTTWNSPDLVDSPLRIETTISVTGDKRIDGSLAPVTVHPMFRSQGGRFSLFVSDHDDSANGSLSVGSLEFGVGDNEATAFALNSISGSIKTVKGGMKQVSAAMESGTIASSDGVPWSFEDLEFYYERSPGEKPKSLGSVVLTAKRMAGSFSEATFEVSNARFGGNHSENREFHSIEGGFYVDSLQTTFFDRTEMRHYSRLMEQGVDVNFGVRISHDVIDAWKAFEPEAKFPRASALVGSRIRLTSKQKKDAIRWLEATLENFRGWNEAMLRLKIGRDDEQVGGSAIFGYDKSASITEQRTVADILRASRLLFSLSITKAALDASPQLAEGLRFLIAEGTLVEEGDWYYYRSRLENGELEINGKPNRILHQLDTLLQQEIQWDSAFLRE